MGSFTALFEEYAAASLDKQWALNDLFGEADWELNLDAGTMTLATIHTFPVQIIGTESYIEQTWLWAWGNKASNIPPQLLRCVEQVRASGMSQQIPELTQRMIDLTEVSGHEFALVATGLCNADCYYRGPYEGGAVFVLLDAPVVRAHISCTAIRIVDVFTHLISLYPVNHRRAFKAYIAHKGYVAAETAHHIEVRTLTGEVIQAAFDPTDRLTKLTVEASQV